MFFTHAGMHGALEGAWHGVPAVAMPIFVDQGDVTEMLRTKGVAVRIDKEATTAQVVEALQTVIHDRRYVRQSRKKEVQPCVQVSI